jgi:EAL and modified HD-GYP domain-containing signal transduction protein
MGLWKLLRSWVSGASESPAPGVRVAPQPTVKPPTPAAPTPDQGNLPEPVRAPVRAWMLRRDELLDESGRLAGYRFVVHGDAMATLSPDVMAQVLHEAGVPAFAERRLALIHLPDLDWARSGALSACVTPHWVWHVDVSRLLGAPQEWLAALHALRELGHGLALSGLGEQGARHPALDAATHVVLDFTQHSPAELEATLRQLKARTPAVAVAVERVPSWADRHWCMAMGVQWASGPFLATADQAESGRKLSASRLVLLEMLNQVRAEADAQTLAAVAKRDPGVAVQLLAAVNSAQHGLQTAITGLDQAIMMMGRQSLYRWLAVAVFRSGGDNPMDATLLELALSRARLLELVGQDTGAKTQADELFLVGLLSFADVLLGQPMTELLKRLSLPAATQEVLLRTEGPYAPHLLLALAIEKCHSRRVTQLAQELGIDVEVLQGHRNAALLWAEEVAC